jgi:hypothetical protein
MIGTAIPFLDIHAFLQRPRHEISTYLIYYISLPIPCVSLF